MAKMGLICGIHTCKRREKKRRRKERESYRVYFDYYSRYSAQGMWGRASYFAYNASYSHKYGFRLPDAQMQMFVARVVVGKNHRITITKKEKREGDEGREEQYMKEIIFDNKGDTPSDGSIIKPPDGYDSVSGETGSSLVYMVYENGRAYPEYLVTYTA